MRWKLLALSVLLAGCDSTELWRLAWPPAPSGTESAVVGLTTVNGFEVEAFEADQLGTPYRAFAVGADPSIQVEVAYLPRSLVSLGLRGQSSSELLDATLGEVVQTVERVTLVDGGGEWVETEPSEPLAGIAVSRGCPELRVELLEGTEGAKGPPLLVRPNRIWFIGSSTVTSVYRRGEILEVSTPTVAPFLNTPTAVTPSPERGAWVADYRRGEPNAGLLYEASIFLGGRQQRSETEGRISGLASLEGGLLYCTRRGALVRWTDAGEDVLLPPRADGGASRFAGIAADGAGRVAAAFSHLPFLYVFESGSLEEIPLDDVGVVGLGGIEFVSGLGFVTVGDDTGQVYVERADGGLRGVGAVDNRTNLLAAFLEGVVVSTDSTHRLYYYSARTGMCGPYAVPWRDAENSARLGEDLLVRGEDAEGVDMIWVVSALPAP